MQTGFRRVVITAAALALAAAGGLLATDTAKAAPTHHAAGVTPQGRTWS